MKPIWTILAVGIFLVTLTTGGVMAGNMSHKMPDGKTMGGMSHEGHNLAHAGHGEMDHSGHKGENIHNAMVDGYKFAYHLIDMQAQMKAMQDAGHGHEMAMTHHLMVFVQRPDGKTVENAKVGYLVEGPDGVKQKRMCMAMSGGYGSDVNFNANGNYIVKTKIVADGKKLIDKFTYSVQ
ncbi:MAG: hypothetical protein JRH15_06840 [Deltaproteobacteria bacterium]|nr:hypothetical protein [Deltaproteobacteria bacterium]